MKRSGFTVQQLKDKALGVVIFQRHVDDREGYRRDDEWRTALYYARTWEQVVEALPRQHPLAATAQGREGEE